MSPLNAIESADDLAIIIYVAMFLVVALGAVLSVAIGAACDAYRARHRNHVNRI